MKSALRTTILLAILAVAFAGCSDDDDPTTDPTSPNLPAEPVELSAESGQQPVWLNDDQLVSRWGGAFTLHTWSDHEASLFVDLETTDYIQTYDISPDGTTIAYSTHRWQWYDLVLYDRQEQTERTIRQPDVNRSYYTPRWSPDGSRIVCNGGGKLLLATHTSGWTVSTLRDGGTVPNWSPDGQRIVYLAPDGQVHTIGIDGTGDVQVTSDASSKGPVAWSPDGTRIAVTISGSPSFIRVVSATTGETVTEIHDETDLNWAAWSPNGHYIACSRDFPSSQMRTWIYPVD